MRTVARLAAAVLGIMALGAIAMADAPRWLGPTTAAASPDGKRLYVALSDAKQVCAVDLAQGRVVAAASVPGEPTSLVADAKSNRLYAVCASPKSVVAVLDAGSLRVLGAFPVGHTATGAALSPDGSRLFVCNRFDNTVSVMSLPDGKEAARVATVREPVGVAIAPDGRTAFVINHLPANAADQDNSSASVTAIDAGSLKTSEIRLLRGSSSVRGVCVSPDGKYVFLTHLLSRNALPTTQLERGWMNTNAISVIDAKEKRLLGAVLLDDVDLGAANPWGIACTADGKTLCVAHSGTHELSAINVPGMIEKLLKSAGRAAKAAPAANASSQPTSAANTAKTSGTWSAIKANWGRCEKCDVGVAPIPLESANDLGFLLGLRSRIALPGKGPRGLTIVDGKAYAAMYFSDSIAVVDLREPCATKSAATIALGPSPKMTVARQGQLAFHDATLCFQHWQSCASCHPDGRADSLNWDLMNDGYGNPKNTKSMLLAHHTPPAMSESVRESAEMAVRAGFKSILFVNRPESETCAVDEYLKSLQPIPSPHLVNGQLSESAVRGRRLFESKRVGCAECHPAPLFTNLKPHDVGTRSKYDHVDAFDTPTLIETWRTAPYLHDGSYATVKDLILKGQHGKTLGDIESLSEQEINDLVEYVLSL
jgi:DNA-binding beta-propeller fold protein YncE